MWIWVVFFAMLASNKAENEGRYDVSPGNGDNWQAGQGSQRFQLEANRSTHKMTKQEEFGELEGEYANLKLTFRREDCSEINFNIDAGPLRRVIITVQYERLRVMTIIRTHNVSKAIQPIAGIWRSNTERDPSHCRYEREITVQYDKRRDRAVVNGNGFIANDYVFCLTSAFGDMDVTRVELTAPYTHATANVEVYTMLEEEDKCMSVWP